jgi:hypothetical protein
MIQNIAIIHISLLIILVVGIIPCGKAKGG